MSKKGNTIVLILAAGKALRMKGCLKQLLPIGDTTIIQRILTQVENRGHRAIVITHNDEIAAIHDRVHNPKNRETTCNSLLSTAHLWDDRTIVLLGDVIYSDKTMDDIFDCYDPLKAFGNSSEIFAIVIRNINIRKIKTSLRKGAVYPNKSNKSATNKGKLRYFYRAFAGIDMDTKEVSGKPPKQPTFHHVRDWTMDVDTPHHYNRVQVELVNKNILEKK